MRSNLFHWTAWPLLFAGFAGLFAIGITRPVDLPSWHEFDDAAIARSYVREGFHFFRPAIDWRKDGPGYTEMEFPAFPWLIAVGYRVFGAREIIGRALACSATLLSLYVFRSLALTLLSEAGAWAACLFFGFNRIVVYTASAIQAEAFLFLFYLLAAQQFLLWRDGKGRIHYWISLLATSAAILAKAPAAHIGLFFLLLCLIQQGKRVLRSPALWFFAIATCIPPALWYAHAHRFWTMYGNSMGVSNEFHWIGWDVIRSPHFITGLVGLELLNVWLVGGLLAAVAAVPLWRSSRATQIALLWLAAIFAYYFVVIRTTSASWSWYYHLVSVPPAALLVGVALERFRGYRFEPRSVAGMSLACLSITAVLWDIGGRLTVRWPRLHQIFGAELAWWDTAAIVVVSCFLMASLFGFPSPGAATPARRLALPAFAAMAITFVTGFHLLAMDWRQYSVRSPEYMCSTDFAKHIPPGVLLITSGGRCIDDSGHPLASDAPHMFYWLDRKGFSLCETQQSLARVNSFRRRGASFFVAEKIAVAKSEGFAAELMAKFPVAAECDSAWLLDLDK